MTTKYKLVSKPPPFLSALFPLGVARQLYFLYKSAFLLCNSTSLLEKERISLEETAAI